MALAGCNGTRPPGDGGAPPPHRQVRRLVLLDGAPWSAKLLRARGERVESAEGRLTVTVRPATAESLAHTLRALRTRMRVVCDNIRNLEVTRRSETEKDPYRRQIVTVDEKGNVRVEEDPSDFRRVYRPDHPDADKDGHLRMPNVYRAVEEADLAEARGEYALIAEALERLAPEYVVPDAESFLPALPPERAPAAPSPSTPAPTSPPPTPPAALPP